jgi:hypothetical protein
MRLKPIGKNQTEVEFSRDFIVFFSYSTPVCACIHGQYYRTSEKHSQTTSKHISSWLNGAQAIEKDQSFFDNLA